MEILAQEEIMDHLETLGGVIGLNLEQEIFLIIKLQDLLLSLLVLLEFLKQIVLFDAWIEFLGLCRKYLP